VNTQTHLLVAAALLYRSSSHPNLSGDNNQSDHQKSKQGSWLPAKLIPATQTASYRIAVLLGALIPDASLFVMWMQAKARGIEDSRIWGELYYSDFWQQISAISNAIPLFVVIVILGWWLTRRARPQQAGNHWTGYALIGLGLAGILHGLSDLPLHVDDGHPHFWPISSWIFRSPVSYWDSNHYANIWIPIEFLIAMLCGFVLWRQFRSLWARIVLVLALLSYPAAYAYWFLAFG